MIKNISIGTKISTRNFDFIPEIYAHQDIIDFMEIILMPEFTSTDINIIEDLKLPYVIHIPSSIYGIDFGNPNRNNDNAQYIKKINRYAKKLKPLCYIVHPESGDLELSIKNMRNLHTRPLALENMPLRSITGGVLLGYDPSSLTEFFRRIPPLEFCFDISHAIKTAISLKKDYLAYITEFLAFKKPFIVHLAGSTLDTEFDTHLHLEEGQYDIPAIKQILLHLQYPIHLTLETPKRYENKLEDDLRNIRFFLES